MKTNIAIGNTTGLRRKIIALKEVGIAHVNNFFFSPSVTNAAVDSSRRDFRRAGRFPSVTGFLQKLKVCRMPVIDASVDVPLLYYPALSSSQRASSKKVDSSRR